MSFLTSSEGAPSTKKAVISLWFRVPKQTIDDITQEYQAWKALNDNPVADPGPRRRFLGIVPLMTFGPAGLNSRKVYQEQRETGAFPGRYEEHWSDGSPDCSRAGWSEDISQVGPWQDPHHTFGPTDTLVEKDFVLDGSYIGVDCTATNRIPALSVNIVMPESNKASMPGASPAVVSHTSGPSYVLTGTGICPGAPHLYFTGPSDFPLPPGILCYTAAHFSSFNTLVYEGNADVLWGRVPETFRLLPSISAGAHTIDANAEQFQGAKIEPDHWHHLLLSFDFTANVSTRGQLVSQTIVHGVNSGEAPSSGGEGGRTSSTCLMWVALDDKNLTQRALSVFWPNGYSNPNGILPINAMAVAQSVNYSIVETNNPQSLCNGVNYTITQINQIPEYSYLPAAVDMSNIGLPADDTYVDAIRQCEMAELQVFTGVSLKTGETVNRRAFVDPNGKPVPPTQKKEVDPSTKQVTKESGSIELLGKEPEILLHKSGNWKKGMNTGTGDQFVPTAKIISYKPDPSLRGDQGKPGVAKP